MGSRRGWAGLAGRVVGTQAAGHGGVGWPGLWTGDGPGGGLPSVASCGVEWRAEWGLVARWVAGQAGG